MIFHIQYRNRKFCLSEIVLLVINARPLQRRKEKLGEKLTLFGDRATASPGPSPTGANSMKRLVAIALVGISSVLASARGLHADQITIQFSGLDLTYNGSTLYDTRDINGGLGIPAEATPLVTATFFLNNTLVGLLTSDIFIDVILPRSTSPPPAVWSTRRAQGTSIFSPRIRLPAGGLQTISIIRSP